MRKARQLFEESLQVMSLSHDIRGLAFVHNCLALVLMDTGDVTGAMRHLRETIELGKTYERVIPTVTEAKIYMAACLVMQGKLDEASKIIHETFDLLRKHGWIGMAIPPAVYRICAETFDALGDTENLQAALDVGHQAITDVADKIGTPEWRQSFLENVPNVRAFMEMWERSKN
jgi:ATP/maltotriose-dependent transcriptional regulator MalT